ncbi:MAG TPA: sulfurtransferase [Thermomicrobiaceae bacterium]|nr:sulfurtransferase [Thermomicrobiaceae bacterium]
MSQAASPEIQEKGYVNPGVLVSTEWVEQHLNDSSIRLVEANEDVLLYSVGHIPGAVNIDWLGDLWDSVVRDFIDEDQFAELCSRLGIGNDTTVVFYGDKNNWWASYAYWLFSYRGKDNLKIMDGGRVKWLAEERPLTKEVPSYPPANYQKTATRPELRAYRDDVLKHIGFEGRRQVGEAKPLVDVRSPAEFSGELMHMADYPQEGTLRGGHIPTASNIPWAKAANPDGTFKAAGELRDLYGNEGIVPDKDVIVYCRIAERSSHTWFVLHELLGYPSVRNYDGSWTEWGNSVGVPIEK